MIANVQALRAIAALLVVWAHLKEFFPDVAWVRVLPSGISGVDLFFVISGFIMMSSTGQKQPTALQFLEKRAVRVLPLYYFFTAVVCLISIAAPTLLKTSAPTLSQIWHSFLFIPFEKTTQRIYPLYYLGWTLNFEVFFYVLFACVIALSWRLRAVMVSVAIVGLVLGGELLPHIEQYSIAIYTFTQPIMLDFVFGVLIGAWATRPAYTPLEPRLSYVVLVCGVIGFFGTVYFLAENPVDRIYAPATHTVVRYGLWAGIIVFASIELEKAGHRVLYRPILALGDASYSLYLSHFLIVGAAIALSNRFQLTGVSRAGLAFVTLLICCVTALLCYRFVENPLSAALRRALGLGQILVSRHNRSAKPV